MNKSRQHHYKHRVTEHHILQMQKGEKNILLLFLAVGDILIITCNYIIDHVDYMYINECKILGSTLLTRDLKNVFWNLVSIKSNERRVFLVSLFMFPYHYFVLL